MTRPGVMAVLFFGSAARNAVTTKSDIDLYAIATPIVDIKPVRDRVEEC